MTNFCKLVRVRLNVTRNSGYFLFLFCLMITSSGFGQTDTPEDDLIYKFKIQGISDPAAAKPILYFLSQQSFATSFAFVDEADCFKIGSESPLTYGSLSFALAAEGYELGRYIEVSDGTILYKTTSTVGSGSHD